MQTKAQQDLIKARLEAIHHGDQSQIDVIFSNSKRLIVEAPAGYGKTKTMISLLFMFKREGIWSATSLVISKAALTLNVRASIRLLFLTLLEASMWAMELLVTNRVNVSNYHGFCRHVLRTYGTLLCQELTRIDALRSVGDAVFIPRCLTKMATLLPSAERPNAFSAIQAASCS